MPDAISALDGRSASAHGMTLREDGLRGMISLRGDLGQAKLRSVCTALTGVEFPDRMTAKSDGQQGLCWMSPDEVLVLVPHERTAEARAKIAEALAGSHHLATDVSDARAVMILEGPHVREVIAKLAPVDLHPESFRPGDFRRTRLGQVAAAFWMRDAESFEIVCFRSVADYAFRLLARSMETGGTGYFPQGT